MTLVIYSGRPDPVWTIRPRHESFKEMKKLLDSAIATHNTYRHKNMPPKLGYKGFLVQQPNDEQALLIVGRETVALQKLLLDTMPEDVMPDALRQKVLQAIHSGAVSANVPDESKVASQQETSQIPSKRDKADAKKILHYAPKFNPARWNNYDLIRLNNNCYNYCMDHITNSYAQPGYASGHPIGPGITVQDVLLALESDGLVKMDVKPTDPCPEAPAQPNCVVAIFVAPGKKITNRFTQLLFKKFP